MAKSWLEKHDGHKHPAKVEIVDRAGMGLVPGQRMVIATPKDVSAYFRSIPKGKTRTMVQLRAALAKKHGADVACPLTTGIFTRISAERAFEMLELGAKPDEVAPFWRVVAPNSPLAKKLTCGPAFIEKMRASEGIGEEPKKAAKKTRAKR